MSTIQSTTRTSSSPPGLTCVERVAAIPIIHSSWETINEALLTNAYTRSTYTTAKSLSTSAVKFTEPLQIRLAPLILQADGCVNKTLDAVQSRFPYPFKVKPEEVASLLRDRRQSVTEFASKTLNDKVKSPAYTVAQGIDQSFTPFVDYFESAVTLLPSSGVARPSTPPDAKYQYQRALALSKNIPGSLYVYSAEQFKQLQDHNALVQHAAETAQSIVLYASSSVASAHTHFTNLTENMIAELQRLHASSRDLSTSLAGTIHSPAIHLPSIPPPVHEMYADFAENLSSTISDLRGIALEELPWSERVNRMGLEIRDRVSPLLENIRTHVSDLLAHGKKEDSIIH